MMNTLTFFLHGLSAGSTYNALITSTKYFDEEFPTRSYEGPFAATFLASSCASYLTASLVEKDLPCQVSRRDDDDCGADTAAVAHSNGPSNEKISTAIIVIAYYLVNFLIYLALILRGDVTVAFTVILVTVAVMGMSSALFQRACFRGAASIEGGAAILAFNSGFAGAATVISVLSFADYARTNFVFTAVVLCVSFLVSLVARVRSSRVRDATTTTTTTTTTTIEESNGDILDHQQPPPREQQQQQGERGNDSPTYEPLQEDDPRVKRNREMTVATIIPLLTIVIILVGTLSVFPNLIVKLRPSSMTEKSDKEDFTSSLFLFFNLGDFGGRLVSPLAMRDGLLTRAHPHRLLYLSLLRTLALSSLFVASREVGGGEADETGEITHIMYTVATSHVRKMAIDSSGAVQAIVLLHGLANGFCYSTACAFATTISWHSDDEKRRAGSMVGLVTLVSLAIGGIVGSLVV